MMNFVFGIYYLTIKYTTENGIILNSEIVMTDLSLWRVVFDLVLQLSNATRKNKLLQYTTIPRRGGE